MAADMYRHGLDRHSEERPAPQQGAGDGRAAGQAGPVPGKDIFTRDDPREIAALLKQAAEAIRRPRSTPFRSAMSMLTFHINRAGSSLDDDRRRILEAAKNELRTAFGKPRVE